MIAVYYQKDRQQGLSFLSLFNREKNGDSRWFNCAKSMLKIVEGG